MNWLLFYGILVFIVVVYFYANIVMHDGTELTQRIKTLQSQKSQYRTALTQYDTPSAEYAITHDPATALIERTQQYDKSLETDHDIERAVYEVITASGARYSFAQLDAATEAMEEYVNTLRTVDTDYATVLEAEREVMHSAAHPEDTHAPEEGNHV